MSRPKVYISGPITLGDRNANIAQALHWYKLLISDGYAPMCPHLSCFAEDRGCEFPHQVWIDMDLAWVESSDVVLKLCGESKGADIECAHARKLGIPVIEMTEDDCFSPLALLEHWREHEWARPGLPAASAKIGTQQKRIGDPRFLAELDAEEELHAKKQADYGTDGDPFANLRASAEFGVPPWVGAVIRMNDKVSRIKSFLKNGRLRNEPIIDSFRDISIYAKIAKVLYCEENGE